MQTVMNEGNIHSKNISIDMILDDIKKAVAEKEAAASAIEPPKTAPIWVDINLDNLFMKLNNNYNTLLVMKDVSADWVISADIPVFKPFVIFVKKVIRKATLWLMEPAFKKQTEFNNALIAAVSTHAEITYEALRRLYLNYPAANAGITDTDDKTSKNIGMKS